MTGGFSAETRGLEWMPWKVLPIIRPLHLQRMEPGYGPRPWDPQPASHPRGLQLPFGEEQAAETAGLEPEFPSR